MERLTSDNIEEILFKDKQIKWIVDDSLVYRVTINKNLIGNLLTTPINGVVFIVNPNTGHLFLNVIHSSVWSGPRLPNNTAKDKASDITLSLISKLPFTEQPKSIISIRNDLLEILENKLSINNYSNNIILYGIDKYLNCSFINLLKYDKFKNTVLNSLESQLIFYNLYDDWLLNIDSNSAFIRLMIIKKSFGVDYDQTISILNQDVLNPLPQNEHNVWPTLNNENWLIVQSMLLEMIVNNFNQTTDTTNDTKNNTIDKLSQSQLHDIIFKK